MANKLRYKMRQKLISFGEDYTIDDEHGQPAFKVDGKLFRLRETFVIEDMRGNEVATIRQKLIAIRETMNIERGGEVIATVRKALLTPFRDKFLIDVPGGADMVAQGSFTEHEYDIKRGGDTVAEVSKQWFTIRDTYGITIDAGEDVGLILAIAVVIDEMAHDEDERHQGE
jgi:uncharacterized protein YxjI